MHFPAQNYTCIKFINTKDIFFGLPPTFNLLPTPLVGRLFNTLDNALIWLKKIWNRVANDAPHFVNHKNYRYRKKDYIIVHFNSIFVQIPYIHVKHFDKFCDVHVHNSVLGCFGVGRQTLHNNAPLPPNFPFFFYSVINSCFVIITFFFCSFSFFLYTTYTFFIFNLSN